MTFAGGTGKGQPAADIILKIDPMSINWNSDAPLRYFYVQNGGPENPLGFVKLNFRSPHHVYMHDTSAPSIFSPPSHPPRARYKPFWRLIGAQNQLRMQSQRAGRL